MKCRHCHKKLRYPILDLGKTPPSNAFVAESELEKHECTIPLELYVCEECWLVQIGDPPEARDLFTADYAYFSSVSSTWMVHAQQYARMIKGRLQLDASSFVIEIASNDGYLLRNFIDEGIPCLGIEPTDSTAREAEKLGIPVLREFFTEKLGRRLSGEERSADLIIGNNVFAHVQDINDFSRGLKRALKPEGTITLEFPHLMRLVEHNQFDTVYHEHYSYLSFGTACRILQEAGLVVYDVEELPTHGGSLRVYASHAEDHSKTKTGRVRELLDTEESMGMKTAKFYSSLQNAADDIKSDLLAFFLKEKKKGKDIFAYGAAAKGNTLLNYCGIDSSSIPYVVDASPYKQGKYLPGSHIPVVSESVIPKFKPDYVMILPWNIKTEIEKQLHYVREWGGKFFVAIPSLEVF